MDCEAASCRWDDNDLKESGEAVNSPFCLTGPRGESGAVLNVGRRSGVEEEEEELPSPAVDMLG